MGKELASGFSCCICHQHHEVLPLSFSVKAPQAVESIPLEDLERRVVITRDQCVIDGKEFYLRGRIPVPIHGLDEPFIWGVWAEVSPKSFIRANNIWHMQGRELEPAFPGWLNNGLFLYGDTINLEVSIQTQKVGWRPHFTIVNELHPLAIEQREGITLQRTEEIAASILHQRDGRHARQAASPIITDR